MATPVQWGIDQFWAELQRLEDMAKHIGASLAADRAELTRLWASTKTDPNRVRAANNQKLLTPLIHQNSVLRVSHRDIVAKFNQAASITSDALKRAGYSTPQLAGLGVVFAIAPLAAVTIIVAALALAATAGYLTQAQRTHTAMVARLMATNATPEQKAALLQQIDAENKSAKDAYNKPGGFDFGQVAPILALVAVIMLGPQLLALVPRRAAA